MTNQLIGGLSRSDRDLLDRFLQAKPLVAGQRLAAQRAVLPNAYFLDSGVVSVVGSDGAGNDEIEIAMIGREGMIGVATLLGDTGGRASYDLRIQASGSVRRISGRDLVWAVAQSETLALHLHRYALALLLQIAETAIVRGHAKLRTRVTRWLLMMQDRCDGDQLLITHETLARALGVGRPRATEALHELSEDGLVDLGRGGVRILDRLRMEELAAPSYGVAEAEYRRLLN